MKLKHKTLGVELNVRQRKVYLTNRLEPFYETEGGSFIAHNDPTWVFVKEEEWEDVTHKYDESGVLYDALHYKDVRIRKIDGMHNGPCFIVERKKA